MIGSIIAFSVIVEYRGSSEYNYIMFAGISGLVLSFLFMVLYMTGGKAARGKVAAIIDGLWFIFWLAAAGVSTHLLTNEVTNNGRTRASCAFCWITWFLWTLSLVVSIQETRGYEY
ncbi:hypothetical protein ABPG77_005378 [Micractinium sp. CCAP 211/92]